MSRYEDKSSRTLTVGQLIDKLSRLNPNLPVVMSQHDEPSGDYGVRSIEVSEMQRENIYAPNPFGRDVFHSHISGGYQDRPKEWWTGDRYDQPSQVVFLSDESEWQPTIDGSVGQHELESGSVE